MPSAGFEPAIPVTMRPQSCALDRTATVIGHTEDRPIFYESVYNINFNTQNCHYIFWPVVFLVNKFSNLVYGVSLKDCEL